MKNWFWKKKTGKKTVNNRNDIYYLLVAYLLFLTFTTTKKARLSNKSKHKYKNWLNKHKKLHQRFV